MILRRRGVCDRLIDCGGAGSGDRNEYSADVWDTIHECVCACIFYVHARMHILTARPRSYCFHVNN